MKHAPSNLTTILNTVPLTALRKIVAWREKSENKLAQILAKFGVSNGDAFSIEARARMSVAQKASWANRRAKAEAPAEAPAKPVKRKMSAAAKRAQSKRMKARWRASRKAGSSVLVAGLDKK